MKLSQIIRASQQLQKYQDPVRPDMDTTDTVFSDVEEDEEDEESDEEK